MRRGLVALVLVLVLAPASLAQAESSIDVRLNAFGEQLASELGIDVPAFIVQAEDRIDELYRLSQTGELLRAFANIAAFAQRGLGVDYDPDAGDIMVGLAATGFHGDIAIGAENTLLASSSLNAAVMTGVNLARWGLPRHSNWMAAYALMQARGLDEPPCTVTAELLVKLRAPTPLEAGLHLRARPVQVEGDRVVVEASLEANGKVTATCRGVFVAVKEGHPAFGRW